MYFIRKHIDMGILDIMYQVSQQFVDIIKLMVHNEIHQVREFEANQVNYIVSTMQGVQGYQSQTYIAMQSHTVVTTTDHSQTQSNPLQ